MHAYAYDTRPGETLSIGNEPWIVDSQSLPGLTQLRNPAGDEVRWIPDITLVKVTKL